ncbi:MAG: ComF family protein [Ignavibacteriae bacterium]|nr:ComF family protein [Ignavibacteriota bacterium]
MLKSAITSFTNFVRPAYELIYPPTCLACECHLADITSRICADCWSKIRRLTSGDDLYCEKLNELVAGGNVSGFASAFHFEKDGVLQNLIHQLKYREMTRVGTELGRLIGESLREMLGGVAFDAIVPIPLHPARERERGYNQSEIICRAVSRDIGVPTRSLLKRIRHTKTQTKLDSRQRKENVAGAFALRRRFARLVDGKMVLLVDDIITTGATVDECARVLKRHGADRVFAASVAVPDHTHLP